MVVVSVLLLWHGTCRATGDDNWDVRFSDSFDGGNWFDNDVRCIIVEDGWMFAGGDFLHAGSEEANYIAYWNGYAFSPLGSGLSAPVHAIALDGNMLYAGGEFLHASGIGVNRIAAWNGYEWSALGAGFDAAVYAIAVSGDEIYAGGEFMTADGDSVHHIARWDGSTWSPLVTGTDGAVYALAVHDGDLYVGGRFTEAGGVTVNRIAKWDGSEWSPLGDGVSGKKQGSAFACVYAIRLDGDGDCYIGGNFLEADGRPVNYIARWDGWGWNALDWGLDDWVYAIDVCDEGVVAGGRFLSDGLVMLRRIGLWDGTRWCVMGGGTGVDNYVLALDSDGAEVYLAGMFNKANQHYNVGRIARWREYRFYSLTNSDNGAMEVVTSLTVQDGNLFVGGGSLRMWNGDWWQQLGGGTGNRVLAVAADDNYVYAGGTFAVAGGLPANKIARWDGSSWTTLGPGIVNGMVFSMVLDASDLYVGGEFDSAGFVTANNIARWDGMWSTLDSGTDGPVYAVTMMGGDLYAGGSFSVAGGVSANNIARWDGSTWYPLSGGTAGPVYALASDGSNLYAGGAFVRDGGGEIMNNIAKWDGSAWSGLPYGPPGYRGVNGTVRAIAVCGGDVYAGGEFMTTGPDSVRCVAVFTGGAWSPLGEGVSGDESPYWPPGVRALACDEEGGVYVGGNFVRAGGKSSHCLGLWHAIVAGVHDLEVTPPRPSLLGNYPNPFNPHTEITYEIHTRTRVKLSIYTVTGELIATLVDEVQEPLPGGYRVTWDGRDGRGWKVSSGIYFCRLEAGRREESRKLVLLK
jgi:hypothetical protein